MMFQPLIQDKARSGITKGRKELRGSVSSGIEI
jgi:hypothetical protein